MPFKKLNAFNSYNGYWIEAKKLKMSFRIMCNFRMYIHHDLDASRLHVVRCKATL